MQCILQVLKLGSIAALLCMFTACSNLAQVESRGYVSHAPLENGIEVGKSTKEDVKRLLGSPSTVSSFPPETWYYVARQRETVAFMPPKLVDQNVARIEFDAAGIVIKMDKFDKDVTRDVEYVKRETPTEGRELGVMEQLLGNLGRFNTPKDSTQSRE